MPGLLPGGADEALAPARYRFAWGDGYALSVYGFGLACCAVEFVAASLPEGAPLRAGGVLDDERVVELMVVAGTVTDKLAPAVRRVYDQLADPKLVVSFGSCASSGGPYWDSYCVTKGVDQIVPVDVYVPGCPPRPDALLHGIRALQDRIEASRR